MPAATALDRAPAAVPGAPAAGWLARFRRRFFHIDPTDTDSVVLRHRRIYILPTPRGLAFIGTVATMLVTSLNYALSLGFAVTFLLAGVMAAALLQTYRNLAGMAFAPLVAGEAYVGDAVPFTLTVSGNGAPRFGITVAAGGAAPAVVDLAADGTLPLTIAVPAPRRGRLPLGRLTISSVHPLGIWRGWSYVHFPLAGIVYPAPELDAPPLPPGTAGEGVGVAARDEDADLAGLRAYQAGDPMQRIAWKAVARGAGWHTKEFEGTGGGGTLTLAWSALPASLDAEARLSRLAAWVLAAERLARPFALQLPGAALPEGKGRDHRRAALRALALCPGDIG
jgi:uncharacterized protein (DUF58 family)